jgi:hypothetical protein
VWQLLQEFQALISSYILKYSPPDANEWRSVIQEVTTFLNADVAMPMPRSPGAALPFRVSLRCGLSAPEVKLAPHRPMLLHAVLASYYPRQVRPWGGLRGSWRECWKLKCCVAREDSSVAGGTSGGCEPGVVQQGQQQWEAARCMAPLRATSGVSAARCVVHAGVGGSHPALS